MRIGCYDIDLLQTAGFRLDGGGVFGMVPKALWSKAYPHVDAENRVAMTGNVLLIQGAGRRILVDAGCGMKMSQKMQKVLGMPEQAEDPLVAGLERRGLKPADITDLVYTHLHFDHAGGSTVRLADGQVVPLFENARHHVQAEQLAWARRPTLRDKPSFYPENWEPVAERGLLETHDGAVRLTPDIELRVCHGHTRAMQMVVVHGDGEAQAVSGAGTAPAAAAEAVHGLVHCADLIALAALVPLRYIGAYDNFPLTSVEEKQLLLEEAVSRCWALVFCHDPFTPCALLIRSDKGIVLSPPPADFL